MCIRDRFRHAVTPQVPHATGKANVHVASTGARPQAIWLRAGKRKAWSASTLALSMPNGTVASLQQVMRKDPTALMARRPCSHSSSKQPKVPSHFSTFCHRLDAMAEMAGAACASPAQPRSSPLRLRRLTTSTPGSSASPKTLGSAAGESSEMPSADADIAAAPRRARTKKTLCHVLRSSAVHSIYTENVDGSAS